MALFKPCNDVKVVTLFGKHYIIFNYIDKRGNAIAVKPIDLTCDSDCIANAYSYDEDYDSLWEVIHNV